ncbi:MAG: Nucleotidyl transferase AbiEii toxin, Type IV TA system [Candidatus Magasanikbacteria bacterium]|nr:Nucleotidyl transferase AbiEii toxin, Type IV TA system [Candidatus Magasanikbacteria bacterium]
MVIDATVKSCDAENIRLEKLPRVTRKAFLECIKLPWLAKDWYLAGGTALTLSVGHRQSVDLDFFTERRSFNEDALERDLFATEHWVTTHRERGTLYGVFYGAKISFIAYPFFVPSKKRVRCGSVHILTPEDIAVMKIVAISQRGKKRDFVDLYWYCTRREPLADVILRTLHQYVKQEKNLPHILKSLAYFVDADPDPMPEIFFKATWKMITSFFTREAETATRQLIG